MVIIFIFKDLAKKGAETVKYTFFAFILIVFSIVSLYTWGESHQEEGSRPEGAPPTREMLPVAGIPFEEARAILKRHRAELRQLPEVYNVGLGDGGILVGVYVHTNAQGEKPPTLPPRVQALPGTIEGLPLKILPLYVLPPPSGVIVLRPGGVREEAEVCPSGTQEYDQFGWRFCLAGGATIPTEMMHLPIAGIPYEECLQILERNQETLGKLPGVQSIGMGDEGIEVYTSQPEALPVDVEGLPLIAKPPRKPGKLLNHSVSIAIRPVHGGLDASQNPAQR